MPTGKDMSRRKFSHSVAWPLDLLSPPLTLIPSPPSIPSTHVSISTPGFGISFYLFLSFYSSIAFLFHVFCKKKNLTSYSSIFHILRTLLQASFTSLWAPFPSQNPSHPFTLRIFFQGSFTSYFDLPFRLNLPSFPSSSSISLISFIKILLLHILNQAPFSFTSSIEFPSPYHLSRSVLLHILRVSFKRSPQIASYGFPPHLSRSHLSHPSRFLQRLPFPTSFTCRPFMFSFPLSFNSPPSRPYKPAMAAYRCSLARATTWPGSTNMFFVACQVCYKRYSQISPSDVFFGGRSGGGMGMESEGGELQRLYSVLVRKIKKTKNKGEKVTRQFLRILFYI